MFFNSILFTLRWGGATSDGWSSSYCKGITPGLKSFFFLQDITWYCKMELKQLIDTDYGTNQFMFIHVSINTRKGKKLKLENSQTCGNETAHSYTTNGSKKKSKREVEST